MSLRNPRSPFHSRPSGRTASIPSTRSRVFPYRSTCTPPALVDRLPPIWQLPSDASDNGKSRSMFAAASCTAASVQPASTTRVLLAASDSRMRFRRPRLMTTSSPPARGVAPPHKPVLPPCGTIGTPAAWQRATSSESSGAEPGRRTARARPVKRPRQSVR